MILFGFKSSGKTYLGKLLSRHLNSSFIDTDDLIEKKYHLPVRELYKKIGEKDFRMVEKDLVQNLQERSPTVIAVGGGVILDSDNLKILQEKGPLIYLKVSFETIHKRILKQGTPAFADSIEELKQIYLRRLPIYESIPAICIDVDCFDSAYDIVKEIEKELHGL